MCRIPAGVRRFRLPWTRIPGYAGIDRAGLRGFTGRRTMKTLRIGLIGAGQISYRHAAEINEHPHAEVIAAADPSRERLEALADREGISRLYEKGEELIADSDVDAVSIATPNTFHAPYALAALDAGKHVMLEKPFAMNYGEARKVAERAELTGKVLMVGMNQRFNPIVQTMKERIDGGEAGEIYHGKAFWLRRSGIPRLGTWFSRKELAGGGVLFDIGVHLLDLCLYLMDNFQPEAVSGATYSKFGSRGMGEGGWGMSDRGDAVFDVDDFATALIRLEGGATVSLDVSWAIHIDRASRQNVELFGTEAGINALEGKVMRYAKGDGGFEVLEPRPAAVPASRKNRFFNWIDVIRDEAAAVCTLEQALAVQQILDAIYEASVSGKEVRLQFGRK